MGVVILSTAVSTEPDVQSSVRHAGIAGRSCIASAGLAPEDVSLLINVGVYRDSNMVEPAMAAMVQKEVGVSLDYARSEDEVPAFSFDLMNGACGALSAVHVARAFLSTGSARHVLVVASDTHPAQREVEGFPYASMGGAWLLGYDPHPDHGFGRVDVRTNMEGSPGLQGYIAYGTMSRDSITVDVDPTFESRALAMAEDHVRAYARDEELSLGETFLVTSHLSKDFAADLAARLGIVEGSFVSADPEGRLPHSSALAWGFHRALERGALEAFENVLFVAAGSGLSTACAVYRSW